MTLIKLDLPKLMAQQTSQCSWKNNIPLQNGHSSKTEKKNNSNHPTKGTSWKSKQENKVYSIKLSILKETQSFCYRLNQAKTLPTKRMGISD